MGKCQILFFVLWFFLGIFPCDRCGECCFTVARGPVPRDRCITVIRAVFFYRSAGACPPRSLSPFCRSGSPDPARSGAGAPELRSPFTVARGPVPRDRCMARDRPSPYGNPGRFFHRSPVRDRVLPNYGLYYIETGRSLLLGWFTDAARCTTNSQPARTPLAPTEASYGQCRNAFATRH